MDDSKTVRSDDIQVIDPLYARQKEDVATMRASLLACTPNNGITVRKALHNITVMRVYHQINRIIRFTELMDKIEAKLYESIECSLSNMNSSSPSTWIQLLKVQEQLQKTMIESHKLLQPYLDLEQLEFLNVITTSDDDSTPQSYSTMIMAQDARDKVRTSAQSILQALTGPNASAADNSSTEGGGDSDG